MAFNIYNQLANGRSRYIESVETDDKVIRAAFSVAYKAHEGQLRSQTTGAPYIVHPIMAYHMLRDFGIENALTLSAALLHDALEDCPRYQNHPERMSYDLCTALQEEGVQDAEEISHFLVENLCLELTNPAVMEEGKRSFQVHHADSLSSRVALLKIVDQASSVLDSIIVEDDGVNIAKKREWNYKALDVVKAAASDRERLFYWANLFKVLFSYNMEMLDAQETGNSEKVAQMRADFSYEKAKVYARDMPKNEQSADAAVMCIKSTNTTKKDVGCIGINFNDKGEVCGYHILINQLADRHDMRNACAIDLMGYIEQHSRLTRVTTGSPEIEMGRLVRVNTIKPAISAEEFCAIAKKCGAIGHAFEQQIRDAKLSLIARQRT